MPTILQRSLLAALTLASLLGIDRGNAAEAPPVSFVTTKGRVRIAVGDEPFATYVLSDPDISRPYFAHVRAPGGKPATRNQPPADGEDLMDHPTFHPGIWLAFGDLSGADDWRLLAPVRYVDFVDIPQGGAGRGEFAVRNRYFAADGETPICEELFHCEIHVIPASKHEPQSGRRRPRSPLSHLIVWDSTFSSDREFYFGDQEEMGLGFRVATPLRAQRAEDSGIAGGSGTILDAEGRENEAGVWGHSADWCDYSGVVDGQRVGMTIFCHSQNFRPSWFHARDRGLLVANPFGRAAFDQGELSRVVVKPGESLRLRYGLLVHSGPADEPLDLDAAYDDYVALTRED